MLVQLLLVFYLLVLYQICKWSELLNLFRFSLSDVTASSQLYLTSWFPDLHLVPGHIKLLTPRSSFPDSQITGLTQTLTCLALSWPPAGSTQACCCPHNCITDSPQGKDWHFSQKPTQSFGTFANQSTILLLTFRVTPGLSNILYLLGQKDHMPVVTQPYQQ